MERKDAIRKIEKLMAIADDTSASDQEIQLATYRANKLMLRYKIDNIDLINKLKNTDAVKKFVLEKNSIGYLFWILKAAGKSWQCKISYRGRFNSSCSFAIWGLESDVEMFLPVAVGLQYYTDNVIEDLRDCYIGSDDFRIFKRDYYRGFTKGLSDALKKSYHDMQIDKKYEVAILSVPAIVQEKYDNATKNTPAMKLDKISDDGYQLGLKHGSEYEIERKNLLKEEN